MITVKNLSKNFGDIRAVRGISFEVKKQEVVGFLGPNGAGKSTTMRMITTFLEPNEGEILIDNLDVMKNAIETRKKIGYLPEDAPIYKDMDVIEYLRYIADIRDLENVNPRISEIAELCGITKELYRSVGELSKGYRQRVGLAQAMIHDPEILILDEPTSGLDPNQIIEIRELIRKLGEERTVILSTHILPEVQATCDRAMIINKGLIVADDTIENLKSSAANESSYKVELIAPSDKASSLLTDIVGIENVKFNAGSKENSTVFSFITAGSQDPREEIFRKVVDNDWILLEMSRQRIGLEDVFRQLTRGGE